MVDTAHQQSVINRLRTVITTAEIARTAHLFTEQAMGHRTDRITVAVTGMDAAMADAAMADAAMADAAMADMDTAAMDTDAAIRSASVAVASELASVSSLKHSM